MENTVTFNPLTDADLEKINKGLELIEQARMQARMARAANIDPGVTDAQLNEQEQRLRAIKQVYFPGR